MSEHPDAAYEAFMEDNYGDPPRQHKYLIREVVTYELEAPDAATALDMVINTKDGMVKHFTAVEEREMFEDGQPIDEPELDI